MAWFHAMGAQKVGAHVLFDKIIRLLPDRQGQDQVIKPNAWGRLQYCVTTVLMLTAIGCQRGRRHAHAMGEGALYTVSQDMMAFGALFCRQRIDCGFQHRAVAGGSGLDQRYQQICARHGRMSFGKHSANYNMSMPEYCMDATSKE